MKTYKGKLILTGLALMLSSGVAMAEDPGFYLAPEAGYVLPTDGNVDDTIFLGLRAGYDIDHNWAAEVESGWMQPGYDAGNGVENTDIDIVPIMFNLRYHMRCTDSPVGAYVFGGVGAAINEVKNSGPVELENTVAWQVGAGADYLIDEDTSAFLDARYLWNKPDIEVSAPALQAAEDRDIDLSAVMFTAGVKF